jgi:gamma-glutamyltranspeptidase / glutathione hydrolase
MSFGVMGGNMQPQGHVQTLARMLIAGQQPQAACDAPRWKYMQGVDIEIENTMPVGVATNSPPRPPDHARRSTATWTSAPASSSGGQGEPSVEGYVAASDSRPRRPGRRLLIRAPVG